MWVTDFRHYLIDRERAAAAYHVASGKRGTGRSHSPGPARQCGLVGATSAFGCTADILSRNQNRPLLTRFGHRCALQLSPKYKLLLSIKSVAAALDQAVFRMSKSSGIFGEYSFIKSRILAQLAPYAI